MAKEKECCDIKVTKTKDGYQINVKGVDAEKCIEMCMKNCCQPGKK
jgi:hypothetical protein